MNKDTFNKPSLSVPEQIKILKKRGMIINDTDKASHYLMFLGYYRLSGYMHYFMSNDTYKKDTTFEMVLDHYIFDRKLRILMFDAIERIEVALRSVMTEVDPIVWTV